MAEAEENSVNTAEIWKTLSKINCNKHTEVKKIALKDKDGRKTGKFLSLTYLSWSWAWEQLMENYPGATYWVEDPIESPAGSKTWMVRCGVTVGSLTKTMWLPVMDNKNASVTNPTSRDVSDSSMRCLVKCIAMFGLGHYIYAGEDLPKSDDDDEPKTHTKVKDSDTKESRGAEPPSSNTKAEKVIEILEACVAASTTEEELNVLWGDNKKELANLSKDAVTTIKKIFKARKEEIDND